MSTFVLKDISYAEWSRNEAGQSVPRGLPIACEWCEYRWSDRGFDARWQQRDLRRWTVRLEHLAGGAFGLPRIDLLDTVLGARRAVGCDALLALFEEEGLLAAALKRVGVPPFRQRPLAMALVRLAEGALRLGPRQRDLASTVLEAVDRMIVYSSNQVDGLSETLGVAPERVRFVPYGIDGEFFHPRFARTPDTPAVVAAGRDAGRDYKTLFAALAGREQPVQLMCKEHNLSGLVVPPTVELLGFLPLPAYRQVLASATAVVIPTQPFAYPTGQTVLLHAMALGKCCIISDSPAVRDYVQPGTTALVVPPADPSALWDAIATTIDDPALAASIGRAARSAVEEDFTIERMWGRIGSVMRELTSARPR